MQWLGATAILGRHVGAARHEIQRQVRLVGGCRNMKSGVASVDVVPDLLEEEWDGGGARRSAADSYQSEMRKIGEQARDAANVARRNRTKKREKLRVQRSIARSWDHEGRLEARLERNYARSMLRLLG
jgi:hypothetical protein